MTRVPISFEGEFSDLKSKLSEMENHIKGWGDRVSMIGKSAFTLWAGKQVFDGMVNGFQAINSVLQDSIREATEAARVNAKLEAVIKATGGAAGLSAGEMSKFAESLMGITNIDDDAIKNVEALLATFREIKGDTFKEATKAVLDMSAVMDGDLKGAAVQVGKALNDPMQGLSALSRVGVSFTDQQKDMIKTMQEAGDVAGAQAVILAELRNEFGGAAEAMANAAGHGLGRFSLMLNEVKEDLGDKLLPTLDKFLDTLGTKLKPVLDDVVEKFGNWVGNISDSEIDSFAQSVTNLAGTFGELANALSTSFIPLMESLLETTKELMELIPNSGMVSKEDRKWVGSLNDKQFAAAQKAMASAANAGTFWESQGILSSAGMDVRNEEDRRNLAAALQERQDKINRANTLKHKATGAADGSFIGPLGWASMMGGGAGSMENYKFTAGAKMEDYINKFPMNPLFAMNTMGMAGTKVHSTRMDTGNLDAQYTNMQDRMKELQERANKESLKKELDKFNFSASIESGADVFRRISAGAASIDPAKGTEANTKGILAEMKKLNAKMDKNRKEKGALAG